MSKVKLSSIIDIISGGTPSTTISEYWENGTIGWLSVTDFNNDLRFVYDSDKKITVAGLKNSNTKMLEVGDIIISARGTVGALAQIGKPLSFNQSCFGLRGKKGLADNNYLYYCLKNYVHNIKKRSQGSVFDTINLNSFDLMEIDIHDLVSQQKIASVLASLDSKIELNNRINAELEHMAKTIYDYWFVQFDFPISAEYAASVGQPELAGKPYKSSGGKMVWSDELKREVPEGWEVRIISEFGRFVNGKGIEKTKFSKDGIYPVYGSNGVTGYSNEILFDEPVIAVGRVGANYGEVHYSLEPCWVSDNAVTAQPVKSFYLWWLIETLKKIDYRKIAGGSAQPLITQGQLKELKFIVPQDDIFIVYNDKVKKNYELLNLNLKENQKLTELRDWLLPMLMNGQVKVGDMVDEGVMGMAAEAVEEYIVRGE